VKEKLFVFLTVLLAAYVLYGMFVPPAIDRTPRRPLSTESGPFGYQGLWRWLAAEKIGTQSFRDRYYALADPQHPLAGPGHVMIVSIPYLVTPERDELDALLQWTRRGNTVLIAATLNDTLPWSFSSNAVDALDPFEYLTAMKIEVKPRADADAAAREHWPQDYVSVPAATAHWLLQDVHEIATRSEFLTDAWNLTVNPRMPVYVLATTPTTDADALLLGSVGAGALVVCTYGSLLENSMLGQRDNRSLVVNLLRHHLAAGGRVIFDDGHQGLHTIYDAQAFLRDPRLWGSLALFLAFWVLYAVFAESRLGPPVDVRTRARQADFVRMLAAFLARKVSRRDAGLRLLENFLAQVVPRAGAAEATHAEAWRRIAVSRRIDPALTASLQRDHERLLAGDTVKLDDLQRRLRAARRALS